MSGLRGTRSLVSRFITARRWNSTQASPSGPTMPKDETGNSFQPNWAHLGSGVVSYMVIPAVGAYAVFFWDFGEREHVFQPARRWAARNINRFFSLSPEEKLVVFKDDAEPPVEGTSMST